MNQAPGNNSENRFSFNPHPFIQSPVQTEFDVRLTAEDGPARTVEGPNATNTNPQTLPPELSTVRICCLFNRIKDFGMLSDDESDSDDDDDLKDKDKPTENPSSSTSEEAQSSSLPVAEASSSSSNAQIQTTDSDKTKTKEKDISTKFWPKGVYYRAVKVNSMGTTAALVQGKKYLLVTPYTSPVSFLYRRELELSQEQARTLDYRPGFRLTQWRLQRILDEYELPEELRRQLWELLKLQLCDNAEGKQKPKKKKRKLGKDESIQDLYPADEFEKWMVKEDTREGRCGMYELRGIPDISKFNVNSIKNKKDNFLICLSLDTNDEVSEEASKVSKEEVSDADEQEECVEENVRETETPVKSENVKSTVKSENVKSTVKSENVKSSKKKTRQIVECRCDTVRRKALMHRQLLIRIADRQIEELDKLWLRRSKGKISKSSSSSVKGKQKIFGTSWNFLDVLSGGTAKLFKLNSSNNSIWDDDEVPRAPAEPFKAGEFEGDLTIKNLYLDLLQVRLRLLKLFRLIGRNESDSSHPIVILQPSLQEIIQSNMANIANIDLLFDNKYLSSSVIQKSIEVEIERRIQLIVADVTKSNARKRLLAAIKDMLVVMQRNTRSSSSSSSSSNTQESSSSNTQESSSHSSNTNRNTGRSNPEIMSSLNNIFGTNLTPASMEAEITAEEENGSHLNAVLESFTQLKRTTIRFHQLYQTLHTHNYTRNSQAAVVIEDLLS